jgi:hypothetical protein
MATKETPIGKYWDAPMTEDIRQAFWDIANLSERANLNGLVVHNLELAQRNLYAAWRLQTHMNELGEFEKEEN